MTSNNMVGKIKVKISSNSPGWSFIRQTPESLGVWDNCQFYIDDDTKDCDWWVIIDGVLKDQTTNCYPDNTILVTGEPPSVKRYQNKFVQQFGTVITTQNNIKARRTIHLQLMPWYIGAHYNINQNKFDIYTKSYDELKQMSDIPKNKLISIISSKKTSTSGHRQRLRFIGILKKHFKDRLDIFGSGINHIADKWDGVAPYKYHIAIENSKNKNYWSEKLADSFLSESYPFYFGCPNINDYFPSNAISKINIYKPKEAIEIIENAIKNDYYVQFKQQIIESRNLILDKYQIFPQLCKIINNTKTNIDKIEKIPITIRPEIKRKKNIILRIISKILNRKPAETFTKNYEHMGVDHSTKTKTKT